VPAQTREQRSDGQDSGEHDHTDGLHPGTTVDKHDCRYHESESEGQRRTDESILAACSGSRAAFRPTSQHLGSFSVVGCRAVDEDDEFMMITERGQVVRTRVADVRVIGRSTQGVTLMDVPKKDQIVAVALIVPEEESDDDGEGDDGDGSSPEGEPSEGGAVAAAAAEGSATESASDAPEATGEEPGVGAEGEEPSKG